MAHAGDTARPSTHQVRSATCATNARARKVSERCLSRPKITLFSWSRRPSWFVHSGGVSPTSYVHALISEEIAAGVPSNRIVLGSSSSKTESIFLASLILVKQQASRREQRCRSKWASHLPRSWLAYAALVATITLLARCELRMQRRQSCCCMV